MFLLRTEIIRFNNNQRLNLELIFLTFGSHLDRLDTWVIYLAEEACLLNLGAALFVAHSTLPKQGHIVVYTAVSILALLFSWPIPLPLSKGRMQDDVNPVILYPVLPHQKH